MVLSGSKMTTYVSSIVNQNQGGQGGNMFMVLKEVLA